MFFLDTDEALDIAPAPLPNSGLLHPRRPGIKPTWPVVVDWSHPLAVGLVASVVNDVFAGQSYTLAGSDKGRVYRFNGTSDSIQMLPSGRLDNVTAYCLCRSPTAPTADGGRGPLTREENFSINWDHGSASFRGAAYYRESSGAYHAASYGTLSADVWYGLAVTVGVGGSSKPGIRAYKNGVQTASAGTFGSHSTDRVAYLGRHASVTNYWDGDIACAYVWNRLLNDSEILSLHRDPYQFLKPKLDVLPIQSRNVPGGYALPAAFEQPRSMIPGVKPTWPVEVDWTHELSRGLVQAFIFDGQNMTDLVNGDSLTLAGNARIDRDLVLPSEGSGAIVKNRLVNNGSVSAGWDVDAAIAAYYLFDTPAPRDLVLFGTNMFLFANNTAASPVQPNNLPLQAGYITSTTNYGVNEYYQNGALYRNFSDLATVGGTSTMYIGTRYNLVNTMIGRFKYFYVHDRNLTADEVRRLNADPYQFLKIKGT